MRFIHTVRTAIAAAGVAALFLAGCGPGTTSAPSSPPPAPPTVIPPPAPPPTGTPPTGPSAGAILNPADRIKVENDLKQIGLAYHNYWDTYAGKGPAKIEDLYPFLEGAQTTPSQGLASGKYKVYLNATIAQMTNGTSNTVLGYYKDVPAATTPLPVLMADVSIKTMTADDFKKAAKAGQ